MSNHKTNIFLKNELFCMAQTNESALPLRASDQKILLSLEHQLVLRENSLGYAAAVRIWDRVAKRRLADYQFMNGNLQNM